MWYSCWIVAPSDVQAEKIPYDAHAVEIPFDAQMEENQTDAQVVEIPSAVVLSWRMVEVSHNKEIVADAVHWLAPTIPSISFPIQTALLGTQALLPSLAHFAPAAD